LQGFGTRRHVEPHDKPAALDKGVPCDRGLHLLSRDNVEIEVEFLLEFVLPLFDQAPGRDDEATLQIASDNQLFDEKTRHDRLACTGVISEQEPQRMARQHVAVHRGDLMRQRVDFGGMNCEIGVEEMREPDALRFRPYLERFAVAIEAEGPTCLEKLQAGLIVTKENDLTRPVRPAINDIEGVGSNPLGAHHFHGGLAGDAAYLGACSDTLQSQRDPPAIVVEERSGQPPLSRTGFLRR
jgi:hypothetical protein